MEVVFEKQSFCWAVQTVSGALNQRAPKPALQSIHLETRKGKVVVSATDLRIAIRCTIGAKKVVKAGTSLVHGTRIGALLRDVIEEEIHLRVSGGRAELKVGRSSFKLVSQHPDEYPELPDFTSADVSIDTDAFDSLVARTVFATAREQGRYSIHGVSVSASGGEIEFAATDGRRLAVATARLASGEALETCILPPKMLAEVRRAAAEAKKVEFAVGGGRLLARAGDVLVAGSLLDGAFPAYREMIPKERGKLVRLNGAVFASKLRQAQVLTSEQSHAVTIAVDRDHITIEAKSAAVGEASIEMDASYDGEPVTVAFNPQFFLDILPEFGEEEVGVEISGADRPAVLRREGLTYVMAPIRVRAEV